MKIAHVSETYLPRIGGIETALATLFQHTPELDHVMFTNPWPTAPRYEVSERNVVVRRVPPDEAALEPFLHLFPPSRWAERAAHAMSLFLHLEREANRRRLISSERPAADVIHIHSAARARYFLNLDHKYGLTVGRQIVDWWLDVRRYPGPVLLTDHSLFGGSRAQFRSTFAGKVLSRFPNIVCVERSGYENAKAYAREQGLGSRIWHVPNPVDTSSFRSAPMPELPPLILGYAARVEKKGVAEIFRLAREAPPWTRFHLALAGDPRTVDIPAIPGLHVEWNVPNGSMPAFYARIHVFLDAFTFGVPRTVLESLASGRIVLRIREDRGGPEEIPVNVSPLLPPDSKEVFAYLETLASDRGNLERLSQESRSLAQSKFDAGRIADEYRDIYRSIAFG